MHSNCRLLPDHIVCKITQRDNLRRANTCDPALKLLIEKITSGIQNHQQNLWKKHKNNNSQTKHQVPNTHMPSWTLIHHEHVENCLNTNIILHLWKLSNIVLISKPNNNIDRSTSYRPISLLSVIAMTLEKCLLPYITENLPNTPTQHGYKTEHSTVHSVHCRPCRI